MTYGEHNGLSYVLSNGTPLFAARRRASRSSWTRSPAVVLAMPRGGRLTYY